MVEITLKGHKVAKGKACGEALVSHAPISFMGGVNPETGVLVEKGHELEGVNLRGKILVFPKEKGSTGGAYQLYEMVRCDTAPKGLITLRAGSIITCGAIIANIPVVDKLDQNPLEMISSGDYVELDADQGTVTVRRRE